MIKNFTYLLLGILMMPMVAFSQEEESGPARRAEWERSITQDPKTGLIPRNELEKARAGMLKSARTAAAINTINWKERGPNNVGGRTRALMFDPNDATNKKVWAGGVAGGLWYNNDITDANSSWNKVNDFWDNIAIGDIAFDPSNKQIMYAGTGERGSATVSNTGNSGSGGNGIWKTTNGGTSWTRLTSTIPDYVSSTPSLAVGWREIYKILVNSTGTVFVLNMNGIYKSTNGGVSWTTLGVTVGPSPSYDVLSKVTDMELGTDDILYVSEGSGDNSHQPAIYKATSSAATSFTTITPPGTFANCRVELALAPSTSGASQVIYAIGATSHSLPRVQFFRKSINAGATWTNVTVPEHNDEQDPAKDPIYLPFVGDQGDYGLILGVHATKPEVIYAGGVSFSISYNSGGSWLPKLTWVANGEMMHSDHHAFARRPGAGNEDHAIFGHDGGVSYSANWGITPPAATPPTTNGYPTFGKRVKNYNVTQYFAIDINVSSSSSTVIGGAQDNGTHTITSPNGTVGSGYSINGGDGGLCFIDKVDTNIVISSYTNVVPKININGPLSNDCFVSPGTCNYVRNIFTNSSRGRFINPADYDSPNHTLYMDYSLETEPNARIIRYHVTGSSPNYTALNDTLTLTGIPSGSANPNSGISFLKLGKSTATKTLYIGMATGDVYKVTGIPFARNTTPGDLVIPAASITKIMDKSTTSEGNVSSIDYGTTDENILVVTKSNYNIKSVFYATNGGGVTAADWTSKDETAHGLPNIPIRYALISPLDNKNVLLATELGVWSTQDITATNPGWESTNYHTLDNVRTDMLKYKASDQTVSVGTHGRGIFTGKINENLPCQVPVGLTISSNNPFVVGSELILYSSSRGGTSYAWSGPNSFTSAVQNPTVSSAATAAMAGVYTVTIRSGTTCTATATTMVGVTPTCTPPTLATASSNSPVTVGSPINLTSSSTGGTSQVWAGPSSFTSTAQNPIIASATAVMGGVYTVTITSSGTCTATATTNVVVNPATTTCTPPTGVMVSVDNGVFDPVFGTFSVRAGSSIRLTSSSTGGTSQVWAGPNRFTSTEQNPAIAVVTSALLGIFTVTITSSGTCTATAAVRLTIDRPVAPTATSPQHFCNSGTIADLAVTGIPGGAIRWYNSPTGFSSLPTSTVLTNTTYYVAQIFDAALSDRIPVVVNVQNPPSNVFANSNTPNVGQTLSLNCGGTGVTNFQWTGPNNFTSTLQSPQITQVTTANQGIYTVIVGSTPLTNACTATATANVVINPGPTATIVYVNAANTNTTQNGNAWATAYSNMQTALSSAPANSAFWVAKGVYKPTATTDRNISFNIPSGAKVYGGFAGTETMLSEGNVEGNPTILSGEIGSPSTANDNSYHVVTFMGASSATILDGFTVMGGNASFNSTRPPSPTIISTSQPLTIYDGGGIGLDNGSSPTIINCRIISNDAIQGGGLYATNNSNPMVKNSVFMNNQATFGGGIYNLSSSPTYSNILIAGNKATGGAMYNNGSNPTITNVTIAGNGGYNGAVFNSNSAPVIKNSILWGNISPFNDTQSVTSYSIVEGGYLGIGNLNVNPQFISLSPFGLSPSLSGDYKLTNTSPAIDAGDNGVVGMTDTELGNFPRRFNNGIVDIGAYEFQGSRMGGTVTSIVSGNWETGTTWNIGRKPLAGDTVIINNNHIVTINNDGVMKNIEIRPNATLLYKTSGIKLQSGF